MTSSATSSGLKVPGLDAALRDQVARFVGGLRRLDLRKMPSIAEALDWAPALRALRIKELDVLAVRQTLSLVLKHEDDIRKVDSKVASLVAAATRQQA